MSGAEPIPIEEVENFLEENNVLEEWRRWFRRNPYLIDDILVPINTRQPVPERHKILRAFSYLPPERVKVVIVGHEPIENNALATGLAFSFPKGAILDSDVGNPGRSTMWEQGKSVPKVHDALCRAGILERGGTYDCCHEVWATRGVLLLNASLILKGFMPEFILEVLRIVGLLSQESRLFVACWGTDAYFVGTDFSSLLASGRIPHQVTKYDERQETREGPDGAKFVIYIGDHPTYPPNRNCYLLQAAQQFREINEVYPGLFDLENLAVAAERGPDDN